MRKLLTILPSVVSLLSLALIEVGKATAGQPPGFAEYWGSHPSDNSVIYSNGTYMYPCMGRHCEVNDIEWVYGGKAFVVRGGIIKTEHGDYYCSPRLLPERSRSYKCTSKGFLIR